MGCNYATNATTVPQVHQSTSNPRVPVTHQGQVEQVYRAQETENRFTFNDN